GGPEVGVVARGEGPLDEPVAGGARGPGVRAALDGLAQQGVQRGLGGAAEAAARREADKVRGALAPPQPVGVAGPGQGGVEDALAAQRHVRRGGPRVGQVPRRGGLAGGAHALGRGGGGRLRRVRGHAAEHAPEAVLDVGARDQAGLGRGRLDGARDAVGQRDDAVVRLRARVLEPAEEGHERRLDRARPHGAPQPRVARAQGQKQVGEEGREVKLGQPGPAEGARVLHGAGHAPRRPDVAAQAQAAGHGPEGVEGAEAERGP
ncbi:hypothetical protein EG872_16170, partial [Enterococcus faecalis]